MSLLLIMFSIETPKMCYVHHPVLLLATRAQLNVIYSTIQSSSFPFKERHLDTV